MSAAVSGGQHGGDGASGGVVAEGHRLPVIGHCDGALGQHAVHRVGDCACEGRPADAHADRRHCRVYNVIKAGHDLVQVDGAGTGRIGVSQTMVCWGADPQPLNGKCSGNGREGNRHLFPAGEVQRSDCQRLITRCAVIIQQAQNVAGAVSVNPET